MISPNFTARVNNLYHITAAYGEVLTFFTYKLKCFFEIYAQATKQPSNQATKQPRRTMDFYTDELSSRYIYPAYSGHISEERARTFGGYRSKKDEESDDEEPDDEEWSPETRIVSRKVDTTEYSVDVLVGKMSRMTIEDKKAEVPEEVIVLNGTYIVCD